MSGKWCRDAASCSLSKHKHSTGRDANVLSQSCDSDAVLPEMRTLCHWKIIDSKSQSSVAPSLVRRRFGAVRTQHRWTLLFSALVSRTRTETRSKVVSDRFQHPSTRSGRPQNKLRPDLTCGFACEALQSFLSSITHHPPDCPGLGREERRLQGLMELGTRHLLCTRELDPCPVPSKQP
ncbi:hypothetical protein INR49_006800 [Caranx melampygus]|nr:hypothetical protein INR49_006800 [Caranx melampygus]